MLVPALGRCRWRVSPAHGRRFAGWKQNAGSALSASAQIKADTTRKLADLDNHVRANRQAVVEMLLGIICKVQPQLH